MFDEFGQRKIEFSLLSIYRFVSEFEDVIGFVDV